MKEAYDIIIVGGGLSGSMAAVAAARNDADVLLVESAGFLGGMPTVAGVGPMMSFHAGSEQVIRGLTDEMIERLKRKGKSPGHVFDTTGYVPTVTPFDAEAMKRELELMVLEAGGQILYHTMLAGVTTSEGTITSITVCNKDGLGELKARVFVDATGDADLSAWAGVDVVKGRPGDGLCQPMTLKMKFVNVDCDRIRSFIKEHPEEFPRLKGNTWMVDKSSRLSMGGYGSAWKKAVADGAITFKSHAVLFFETNNKNEVIINSTRVAGYDPLSPEDLTRAEIEGRRQAAEIEIMLKKYVVGFENATLVSTGPRIGVRSSRQIRGLYTLTPDDVSACTVFEDRIACSAYPVDVHPPEGQRPAGSQVNERRWEIPEGGKYSIPYRCLVNEKIDNLVTVGRCISATFEAQGSMRTTPTVGAIGHAGGVAAALAVREGLPARDVPIEALQALLVSQGAYLETS